MHRLCVSHTVYFAVQNSIHSIHSNNNIDHQFRTAAYFVFTSVLVLICRSLHRLSFREYSLRVSQYIQTLISQICIQKHWRHFLITVSVSANTSFHSVSYRVIFLSEKMPPKKKPIAKKIETPRNSHVNAAEDDLDTLENSQNSQNSKLRSKNYSADESAALITCCERYHSIISKNSNRDKDKLEKKHAWEKIKKDFDKYCHCQGIHVSKKISFSGFMWICV